MTKRKRLAKDAFFRRMEQDFLALTYDDVRLRSGYSKVMPADVSLDSLFSRNVGLKVPIVSAAMDRVTEYEMAIAMAELGGLGIIHRNLSPRDQAKQVARVKLWLNGVVEKPICVFQDDTIESIFNMRDEKGYKFSTFPVLNRSGKLVGILTGNDFEFCTDVSVPAREVMSTHLVTAKSGTSLDEAYKLMKREKKKVLPLVKKGEVVGMYTWSDVKRIRSNSSSYHNLDEKGQLRVGAAIGVYDDAYSRVETLVRKGVDVVVIDTAHGDSKSVLRTLKAIKKEYPSLDVVVGNISEPESATRLLKAGADGIKVGQGPGSICTTRVIAGTGCPQVTAVRNCAKEADRYGVPVCADGGITTSGDIPIAIGAGASSVMMGNMLAGTKEAPGRIFLFEGRQWMEYRGMGSLEAMQESSGSRARYRQKEGGVLVPEGVSGRVPYKGEVAQTVYQLVGGLRAGMGYVGAKDIPQLRRKANFRRITDSGRRESHPHDVAITRGAPNYPGVQQ